MLSVGLRKSLRTAPRLHRYAVTCAKPSSNTGLNALTAVRESVKVGGEADLTFSTGGQLAHLASGSGVCAHGGSVVHAAVSTAPSEGATNSFLPLTVDYRSRSYAFGTIPKNVNRRERHGGDEEVLVCRAIDRAVRPLFPKGYVGQVQLIATAHSADGVHDPVVASVNAASLALMRADVPWAGPIGCVRMGLIGDKLVVNPTVAQMSDSLLDLMYAGSADMPLMMECSAHQVPEDTIRAAMAMAQDAVRDIAGAQSRLLAREALALSTHGDGIIEMIADEDVAKDKLKDPSAPTADPLIRVGALPADGHLKVPKEMQEQLNTWGHQRAVDIFLTQPGLTRKHRGLRENALQNALLDYLHNENNAFNAENIAVKAMAADATTKTAFREVCLTTGVRVDGRKKDEVRPIKATADVLPAVHGSGFFQRGDTHVLCSVTLGPRGDAKVVAPLNGSTDERDTSQRFMMHYDFPPYCTNVIGKTMVNRRMVGHGALAEKALRPVMPSATEFPYVVRVFAECTSSSGSSSMGSACGASLALLDAGVPLLAPVAGVSVGVVAPEAADGSYDWKKRMVLTDLLGTEDYYGLMDFKVAGTAQGVTAFQMDMKSAGMPLEVLGEALDAARRGRLHILEQMHEAQPLHRATVKEGAPHAEIVQFDPERKMHLVGPGGEMLRHIQKEYGVDIDTYVEGQAYIFGNPSGVADARMLVQELVAEVTPGDVFAAEVLDIKDFGAMVKITRAQEAILHVSELTHDDRLGLQPVESLLAVGQRLDVQVLSVDKALGAVRVSRKLLMDPAAPDSLVATPPPKSAKRMQDLPAFTAVPPRRYSKDFFKNNVATVKPVKIPSDKASNVNKKSKTSQTLHITPVVEKSNVVQTISVASTSTSTSTSASTSAAAAAAAASATADSWKRNAQKPFAGTGDDAAKLTQKNRGKDAGNEDIIQALVDKRSLAKSNQQWAEVSRFTKRLRNEYGVVVQDNEDRFGLEYNGKVAVSPGASSKTTPRRQPIQRGAKSSPSSPVGREQNKPVTSRHSSPASNNASSKPASKATSNNSSTNSNADTSGKTSFATSALDRLLGFVGWKATPEPATSIPAQVANEARVHPIGDAADLKQHRTKRAGVSHSHVKQVNKTAGTKKLASNQMRRVPASKSSSKAKA